MKTHHLLALLLAATLCSTGFADTPTLWKGSAGIVFKGTSTLHDWSGTVTAEPFNTFVTLSDDGQPRDIKAEVSVKAAGMDTAEPKRDENMQNAMHVADHPLITAKFDTPFTQMTSGKSGAPQTLPFTLTILGKQQKVQGTITNWVQEGNNAQFDVDFDVSMKSYGIKVPSVLLVIRVGDLVKVHAGIKLIKSQAAR